MFSTSKTIIKSIVLATTLALVIPYLVNLIPASDIKVKLLIQLQQFSARLGIANLSKYRITRHVMTETTLTGRTPVFFVSHGGPTFMYNDEFGGNRGCYKTVQSIGQYIKQIVKPKFVVVVSGHWESESPGKFEIGVPDTSSVSAVDNHDQANMFSRFNPLEDRDSSSQLQKLAPEEHSLIYDFYGFPDHLYKERFHVKGSLEIASRIKERLTNSGLNSVVTKRGLDHGVWVPLKVAFSSNASDLSANLSRDTQQWDLDCPLVQVSLAKTEDFDLHYKLGAALQKFRDEGGVIVTSGSSVHNLRDLGVAMSSGTKALPYVERFNKKLTEIIESGPAGPKVLEEFNFLKQDKLLRSLLYKAHPTLDHLMPIIVGLGAAQGDAGKELYTDSSMSIGWNVYRWG